MAAIVVFVRGTQPNRDGWVANPTANPAGATRTIWAARTAGGAAWKLGEGTTPALSPDGRTVAYAKDGQIYAYRRSRPDRAGRQRRAGKAPERRLQPDLDAAGQGLGHQRRRRSGRPTDRSSPSSATASITRSSASTTCAHGTVTFLAPSVDHDTSPTWSPDGKRIAFIRRPGTPFGQQAHQGAGSIGNPGRSGVQPVDRAARRRGGRGGRGGGDGRGEPAERRSAAIAPGSDRLRRSPAATRSRSWSPTSRPAKARSSGTTGKTTRSSTRSTRSSGPAPITSIFEAEPQEWVRWYSVSVSSSRAARR